MRKMANETDLTTRIAAAVASVVKPEEVIAPEPRITVRDIQPIVPAPGEPQSIRVWIEGGCLHIQGPRRHVTICGSVSVENASPV
jgi:hypothetical protein